MRGPEQYDDHIYNGEIEIRLKSSSLFERRRRIKKYEKAKTKQTNKKQKLKRVRWLVKFQNCYYIYNITTRIYLQNIGISGRRLFRPKQKMSSLIIRIENLIKNMGFRLEKKLKHINNDEKRLIIELGKKEEFTVL